MKRIFSSVSIFSIACAVYISACNEPDKDPAPVPSTPEKGSLVITMDNRVDEQDLELGKMQYTNAAGNQYQVNMLKYYMSNFILVRQDNSADTFKQFQLIDESKPNQCSFTIPNIANGTYKALKFYVGVGPDRNHSGAQDGFLNPSYGMIWMWHTGYTFFKMEGRFINASQSEDPVLHHLGQDESLAKIEIPLNLEIAGKERKLKLGMNLNSVYGPPSKIDFNLDFHHESDLESDKPWMAAMKTNVSNAFSFLELQ